MKFMIPVLAFAMFFVSCSEEKVEPLPDLPDIEIPKDIPGLYTGRLPCDNCKTKMVRISLKEDKTVEVVQTKVMDSLVTDTLIGTYAAADSLIQISLKDVQWRFKRIKFGNLAYLTGAGTPYQDENGMTVELVRIFKAPVKKTAAPADSVEAK